MWTRPPFPSGAYSSTGERVQEPGTSAEALEAKTALIAITYGYSRDHREDLKQWMLALATTHDGDVPLFLQPLDGNSSDKVSLLAAVTAIQEQLREAHVEPSVYVADNGIYSESNMRQLNAAGVTWVSRVSETSTEAKTVLQEGSQDWQHSEDGSIQWYRRNMSLPKGSERWVIVRTAASRQRAQMTLQRQVSRAHASWERKCWHLGTRRFACEADARAALERELKGKPTWVEVHSDFVAHPRHAGKGRPRKEASPATYQWQVVATVTVNQPQVDEETVRHPPVLLSAPMNWRARRSRIMSWSRPTRIKVGSSAAFVFCADPLFLASSVAVSKPERIIALPSNHGPLLAGLSLSRISAASPLGRDRADHSRPSRQAHGTPNDAALVFQCFEGIALLHVQTSTASLTIVLRLESVHQLVLALLGPLYEKIYHPSG